MRRQSQTERRAAVTLIETVIVIAIMAVLTGIMLPAVQLIRDAAARGGCQQHMRQIGIALHSYHTQHFQFPAGGRPWNDTRLHPLEFPSFPWLAEILPWVEQDQLWSKAIAAWTVDPLHISIPPHSAKATVVRVFLCPSEHRKQNRQGAGYTSYLGVSGGNEENDNGILCYLSKVRIADIADGASNTLLVGERPPPPSQSRALWYGGWGQSQDLRGSLLLSARVSSPYIGRPRCPDQPSTFGPGNADNFCDLYHFYSRHRGGANFLFADGAVRFVRYSAAQLLPALATRAGGEEVLLP